MESANVKVQNIFNLQNNITYKYSTNCKYRTAAIQYKLETWFVWGIVIVIVNTLHKGDDDDDDDNNK
jgi:hypothetical protein